MPTFNYAGTDALGNRVTGKLEAPAESLARQLLTDEQHVTVTSLRPTLISRQWGRGRPKRESVLLFTRTTSSLLRSLTLQEALEITREDLGDPRMESILWDVSVAVKRGKTLADALEVHPNAFDPVYVAAVRAGEQANMHDVMGMLATSLKRARDHRRKVAKGLGYPLTVMAIGAVVTLVILYVVVPSFAKAVADAGAEAPWLMKMMLGASQVLRIAGPALLLLAAGLTIGFTRAYRGNERFRTSIDRALMRIPVMGTLLRHAALGAWARLFAILYTSGTPVSAGVRLAALAIGNRVVRNQLVAVADGHAHGRALWQEMKRAGLPPTAAKMTQVGEEGGRLAEMMLDLAEHYDEETSHTVEKLTNKIEPIAIVIIMIPVGLLVAGVYTLMSASMEAVVR